MASAVTVFLSSPDTHSERKLDLHTSIGQLKAKFELITGIPVQNQRIELHDADGDRAIAVLDDDARPLGFYSVRDLQVLKVIDLNPSTSFTGQLHDTAGVEKFELSEAEYAKRQDTVLAYKQRHQLGRFAAPHAADSAEPSPSATEAVSHITVGARCEVKSAEAGLKKRGTVRFVGATEFAPNGVWVGIEYDEPIGKNDGSVNGDRYFTCAPKHGVFVRPSSVTVGDFPAAELNLDDEEI